MARDNPFRNLRAYNRVRIGGRLITAALVAIDGNELTDEWNVQKGTNTSGATAAYRGVNLIEGVKLTFECADGDGTTAEQDYDNFMDVLDMIAPAPRAGSAGPKPPTRSIENAILNRIGLTNICRKAFREYPSDTNSWLFDLTVIQYAPPAPAGTGAQDPSKPSTGVPGVTVDPQIRALQEQRDRLLAQAAAV